MQHEDFKLDAASITDSQFPEQRIIAYHFNIPAERSQDRLTFETVARLVEADFPPENQDRVVVPLYFQISAVYTLIHRDTGAERVWLGSFNPRSRDRGRLTDFRAWDPRTFVDYALPRCQTRRVLNQLENVNDQQETVWSVGDVLSIIVSFQCTVHVRHQVFNRRPQLRGRDDPPAADENGRGRRGGQRSRRTVFRLNLE